MEQNEGLLVEKKDYLFEGPLERIIVLSAIHLILILVEQISRFAVIFTPKVGLSPSTKIVFLASMSFKSDEKCFLFYCKTLFHSQDI